MSTLLRLKDLGRWSSGGTPPKDDEDAWVGDLPWISAKDIDSTELRVPSSFITEQAGRAHSTVVEAGGLLMIVRGMALAHGLPVVLTDRRCAFNQDLRALTPAPEHDPRFLHYSFIGHRSAFAAHIDKAAHGTARVIDSIYHERVLCPTRNRQAEVADFLDRECERIAAAASGAEEAAALLAQQRHEVFERLTLHAPTIALRYRLEAIEQGWSPECEATQAEPGEWGVLKVGCVNRGRFRPEEHKRLPDHLTPRPEIEAQLGDLLMSRANTRELVGSAAVIDKLGGRRLMLCDKTYRLHPHRATVSFLAAALGSNGVRDQIEIATAGASSSMQNISMSTVRALRIPDLPAEAQHEVVDAVNESHRRTGRSRDALLRLSGTLAEYRDALITEAVTGQLGVTRASEAQMDERLHEAAEAGPSTTLAK